MRAEVLQAHLCEREAKLSLPEDYRELVRQMRKHLVDACDEGHLAMKHSDIYGRLKVFDSPLGEPPVYQGIYGGEKDLKRTGHKPHFLRRDGGWLVFTITVKHRRGRPLELIAYDFEVCFPPHAVTSGGFPRFVRFDLNQPAHGNEDRGLRSHLHPGHDDLIVPGPLMTPLELLDLCAVGLPVLEHPRKA